MGKARPRLGGPSRNRILYRGTAQIGRHTDGDGEGGTLAGGGAQPLGDAYGKAYGVAYDHDLSLCHYVAAAAYGSEAARRILDELLQTFPDALKAPGVAAVADSLGFTPASLR